MSKIFTNNIRSLVSISHLHSIKVLVSFSLLSKMSSETDCKNQAEDLKKELLAMQDKRKKLEDELIMNKVVLENNRVGMNDSLVDKDDFPRNDIDVWAVRQARSNIRRLENDAKELVNSMQLKLEELHSLTKPSSS